MVCSACGCEQVEGSHFCRQCGQAVQRDSSSQEFRSSESGVKNPWVPLAAGFPAYVAMQVAEKRMRVRQNLQPLGITWIVLSLLGFVRGVFGALVLRHLVHGGVFNDAPSFLPHLLGGLVPVIEFSSISLGAIGVSVGWGLLARQPWARVVAMIFGIVSLIKIPFGTALGIYTLWVLGSGESAAEWDVISRESFRD